MGYLKLVLFVLVMVGAVGTPLMVEAQIGNLIRIDGAVFCSVNGNVIANATIPTPPFANATVQLECGNGNIVSTTTTNNMGMFTMLLNPMQTPLSLLMNSCDVAVRTPLSNCNNMVSSSLPGTLTSSLGPLGNTIQDGVNITNVGPTGFQFRPYFS